MKRLKQIINHECIGTPDIVAFDGTSLVKMKGILGTLLFGAALAALHPEAATVGRGTGKTMNWYNVGSPSTGTVSHRPKRTPEKALRYRRRKMAEVSRRANWKH